MNRFLFESEVMLKKCFRLFFSFIQGGWECVVCGRFSLLYPVCPLCRKTRFSVEEALSVRRCLVCGKPLLSVGETCLQCRKASVLRSTDFLLPLFPYRLWNKDLMFLWKSEGIRCMSELFAECLGTALRRRGIDVIVPVPPRPGKLRIQGWDQVDELCRFLRFRYGFRICALLERTAGGQQKKLDRKERLETIGLSYRLKSPERLSQALKPFHGTFPDSVCLVDDVCTTGATLESCAKVLKECGIKEVGAVSLFFVG